MIIIIIMKDTGRMITTIKMIIMRIMVNRKNNNIMTKRHRLKSRCQLKNSTIKAKKQVIIEFQI